MGVMTFGYDAEERAFKFTDDGEARPSIPALEGPLLKEWMTRYARVFLDYSDGMEKVGTVGDWFRVNSLANEDLLDALLAYDRTGALGSRDWIESNFTIRDVWTVLQRIARAHA